MTIDQLKEKKEELEHDVQRLLLVFEKDTKTKVNAINLDVFEMPMMGRTEILRDIVVKIEVKI